MGRLLFLEESIAGWQQKWEAREHMHPRVVSKPEFQEGPLKPGL